MLYNDGPESLDLSRVALVPEIASRHALLMKTRGLDSGSLAAGDFRLVSVRRSTDAAD